MNKKIITTLAAVAVATGLTACSSDADVASENLSKAADNFEVNRRIVFYNAITDTYVLQIEGLCSIGNSDEDRFVSITCKVDEGDGAQAFKKHHFFKSDNTVVFSEQIKGTSVSTSHYRVVFKPSTVIPDIDAR